MIIRAIGPVWDGNEVWLLAAGGVLYFAFPLLYASSFSGFYLPLMIVLWLLMLRAIGIEFRAHMQRATCGRDSLTYVSGASILLAVFFGAALGNVIRGVPLNADGYFFEALWTNWRVGAAIRDPRLVHGAVRRGCAGYAGRSRLAIPCYQNTKRIEWSRAQSSVVVLAGAGVADSFQSDCDRLCRATRAGELFEVAHRLPGSGNRNWQPLLHVFRSQTRAGEGRLPGVLHLHCGNAGGCRVRALSQGVAGQHRREFQSDDLQHGRRRSRI